MAIAGMAIRLVRTLARFGSFFVDCPPSRWRIPLCVVLPCDRVVASSDALTAYAGGLDAKEYLLALESRP
jgi:hypothetical protein